MWLSSFEGLTIPFLPFEVDPSYEGLIAFWTYIIILQVSIINLKKESGNYVSVFRN